MEKREMMDLVRIEAFAYTARVQHLTAPAVQARELHDRILQEQIDQADVGPEPGAADGLGAASDAELDAGDGRPQTFQSHQGQDRLRSSGESVEPDQGGALSGGTDQNWDALPPQPPTEAERNLSTPMYDLLLLLPNDDYEGIGKLIRLEVLRRFPQIGVVVGEDFEKDAIQLTIHNVAMIGKAFGDAHALADLEATPRG